MRIPLAERKNQLIAATVELMRRDGVQRVTVRRIAEEAGANPATVSYCFDGKDHLLRHAFDHWLHRMLDGRPGEHGTSHGLVATAERIAEAYWRDLRDTPADALAQLEGVLWAVRKAPDHHLAQSIYTHSTRELAQVFQAALDSACETSTLPVVELARAFLILIDGASLQFLADPANPGHREVFDRLLRLLLVAAVRSERERQPMSSGC